MLRALPYDPSWLPAEHNRWRRRRQGRLACCHPWGSAALALNQGRRRAALICLRRWLQNGITSQELDALASMPDEPFMALEQLLSAHQPACMPSRARLLPLGITLHDWQLHTWLQHLALPADFQLAAHHPNHSQAQKWPLLVVQLEAIAPGPPSREQVYLLLELAHAYAVIDPDTDRRRLLRRLGIQAIGIDAGGQSHWLTAREAAIASTTLGLPQPKALRQIGEVLILGRSHEPGWTELLRPPLLGLPEFEKLEINTWQAARSLASWLYLCLLDGPTLVRINPSDHELRKQGWQQLERASGKIVHTFVDPLHPIELLEELAWRQRGEPPEPIPVTPKPEVDIRWQSESVNTPADAAVCISLYNYENQIEAALESVANQSLDSLELIIVDDASSDNGPLRVRQWLERHGQHFHRTLLLQHRTNGGLAAARNTGFEYSHAPWCFVLDADNKLEAEAVSHCLQLALAADPSTAVVHPLIRKKQLAIETQKETQATRQLPSDILLSVHSWQKQRFIHSNPVDAMALVRRSAWKSVGGYQHIPGGWEDYDFWCCLIEAGYQGIICPEILAEYTVHSTSMLRASTNHQIRKVSRLLQKRHPWLRLETAQGSAEGRS